MTSSANFSVVIGKEAQREAKRLLKKYSSFKADLAGLIASLKVAPQQGEPLGKDCYKLRLTIRSKQKGKSGGSRVITCVKVVREQVFIVAIYDKSELVAFDDKKLAERLINLAL